MYALEPAALVQRINILTDARCKGSAQPATFARQERHVAAAAAAAAAVTTAAAAAAAAATSAAAAAGNAPPPKVRIRRS